MNLGNELYFTHPYVSNSDLLKFLPAQAFVPDLRQAFARGTLLDAFETSPQYVDTYRRIVLGYPWEYTQADFDLARWQRDSLRKDHLYQDLKSTCIGQEEMYVPSVTFEYDGFYFELDCRIKYDLWSAIMWWGVDLKTTAATSQTAFERAAEKYHYDLQRAFYMHVSGAKKDWLIGVGNVRPYKVFHIRIQAGGEFNLSGRNKMSYLAYQHIKQKIA